MLSFCQCLHHHESARVKMPQSENHTAVQFCLLVADISRISAVSTVSAIDIAHNFQLEIGLSGGCLDVCGFALVIPEEDFCQTVTSEVNVVRTKKPTRFGVLQTHDHRTI